MPARILEYLFQFINTTKIFWPNGGVLTWYRGAQKQSTSVNCEEHEYVDVYTPIIEFA